jgi:hypothetical protein
MVGFGKEIMRLALIVTFICLLSVHSRPVEVPTYQELQDKADLVLILKVQAITTREPKPGENVDTNFYQCYTAECKVLGVLKGALEQKVLSIPFFQHPEGIPGFNGAVAAPFSLDDAVVFLAFMKRGPKGQLTPVTGEYDAGLSIKMMLAWWPDLRHLKLPPHPTKPTGAPTNAAPPPR